MGQDKKGPRSITWRGGLWSDGSRSLTGQELTLSPVSLSAVKSHAPPWDAASLLRGWKARGFDPRGQRLLLAVSGGADSMALLRVFRDIIAPSADCGLFIGHVDHGLRGDSAGDARWLQGECVTLGLPYASIRLDPSLRKPRESVEAWARRERYAALEDMAQTVSADGLLTAHHGEDWLETVLLRLWRGEGWPALTGMAFMRDPRIVRPFLEYAPGELRRFLRSCGQTWREDASNADTRLLRNRLRHQIIPRLDEDWPDWRPSMRGIGATLTALRPFLSGLEADPIPLVLDNDADGGKGGEKGDEKGDRRNNGTFLPLEALDDPLREGDGATLLRRLRGMLVAAGGPPARPSRPFLRGFAPFLGQKVWTPAQGWRLQRREKLGQAGYVLFRERKKGLTSMQPACITHAVRIILDALPGTWTFTLAGAEYRLTARHFPREENGVFPTERERRAIFDAKTISSTLVIRTRQAGDRFSPLGIRSSTRKLKAFLCDRGAPADIRDGLPLVFSDTTLAWVPGYGLAEWFKVTPHSDTLLELVLECLNPKTR